MKYVNHKFVSYVNCKNTNILCCLNHGTSNMTKLKF